MSRINLTSILFHSALAWVAIQSPVVADTIYVDNQAGNDAYDGRSREASSGRGGPVRTIARGLQLVRSSDTLNIANNGVPYFESIRLSGGRLSGTESTPFTIRGNGAVLSGARPVPPFAWRHRGEGVWEMRPARKGHYQLLRRQRPVPELRVDATSTQPEIPIGQWAAWRGSILYRADEFEPPTQSNFWFAYEGVGVSMYGTRHVQIQDLTVRHFRLDGVNVHDRCRGIRLVNIASLENGRSGVAASGVTDVQADACLFAGNREHSVRIAEFAIVNLADSRVDRDPDVIPTEQ